MTLHSVVEGGTERMDLDLPERLDLRLAPAGLLVKRDLEHVVGALSEGDI